MQCAQKGGDSVGTSDAILQWVCAVLVVAIPAGLVLVMPPPRRSRTVVAGVAGVVGVTMSFAVDMALSPTVDVPCRMLDAAFAGAIAAVIGIIAAERMGLLGGVVFASAWSLVVFQPVVAVLVGTVPSVVQTVSGAVDYAAVLVTHVAAAASFIILFSVPGARSGQRMVSWPPSPGRSLLAFGMITLGASAWMVGVERVINVATGRTLGNAVAGMVLGAVTWVLIERIAGRRFTPVGLVAGAVVGWGSIGLGVAFLSPMALAASAIIATAAGAALVVRARDEANVRRRAAIGVIIAVVVGGIVLALLADGFGMAATGSTVLVLGQVVAVIAIGLYAAIAALLCWALGAAAEGFNQRMRGGTEISRWAIPDSN